jgi:hypothetical protein
MRNPDVCDVRFRISMAGLLLLPVWLVLGGVAGAQALPFQDLQAIARGAIERKEIPHKCPYVKIHDGKLEYYFGKIDFYPVFEDDDPDYHPLMSLLQIELFKQHYKRGPNEQGLNPGFWAPLVAQAERAVFEETQFIARTPRGNAELNDYLERKDQEIPEIFDEAMRSYARQNGLDPDHVVKYEAVPMTVKVDPPSGTLQMMQILEWYICQKRGLNPEAVMPQIAAGTTKVFNGEYIYKLSYDGISAVPPRRIEMNQAGVATFRKDGSVGFKKFDDDQ